MELIGHPEKYLGQVVTLEIVEPLNGPATLQAMATLEYPKYEIELPNARGRAELSLVTPAFQLQDPNRYKKKFDKVVESPLRATGEFLQDAEMTTALRRPVYVVRLNSWEPLAKAAPVKISSLAELESDPSKWDRQRVVYEGVYENRFEASSLDGKIWLSFGRGVQVSNPPAEAPHGPVKNRVRATGLLFAKPGQTYGHLGGYSFELIADKVEYLNPL